jgi:hypothetical protein
MYLLSLTGENVLVFLLENLGNEYSINEIAKAIKQDYKIVFTSIQKLKEENILSIKRISNINRCGLNINYKNTSLFGYISQKYAMKKLPKKIILILKKINLIF